MLLCVLLLLAGLAGPANGQMIQTVNGALQMTVNGATLTLSGSPSCGQGSGGGSGGTTSLASTSDVATAIQNVLTQMQPQVSVLEARGGVGNKR
jgi:hypothetical protein